ncbi:mannosyltransferase putative-domain-containing protein [Scheffersomyces coipomensis]|uniref:mannosyltransferase putative-domain-containing protein n=1 Tax=Scheffersomyces coipomensis TaxID=1788519 RepID=UPI00315CEEEC
MTKSKKQKKLSMYIGLILCINLWFLIYTFYNQINYKLPTLSIKSQSHSEFDELNIDNNYSFESQVQHDINNDQYKPLNKSILQNLVVELYMKQENLSDKRKIRDIFSSNYEFIFDNHKPESIIGNLNFNQRCDLYFENLYINDHNWMVNPNEHLPMIDRFEFDFESWKVKKRTQLKYQFMKENNIGREKDVNNDSLDDFIWLQYTRFWRNNLKLEQKIMDNLSHLRIFNKCYISNDGDQFNQNSKFISHQQDFSKKIKSLKLDDTSSKSKRNDFGTQFISTKRENSLSTETFHDCADLEQRLYPWLSFHYPVYEHWTGEIIMSPPIIDAKSQNLKDNLHTPPIKSKLTNSKSCFLNKFKHNSNGKGIVLTINDSHLEDTIHLIHLLRALNNKYPIEIVYYEKISPYTKRQIVMAAREQISSLPKSFNNVSHLFPEDYLNIKDKGLPKQDIWFVNVRNVIHQNYLDKFSVWGNKFLATLFNSFEEFILLDADAVLVKNPDYFFNLPEFKDMGAYFYKDRSAAEFRPSSDSYFFKKLAPSLIDNFMFDIPVITEKSLNINFFDGMVHYMESGVVVINKVKHMNSILLLPQLYFMEPVRLRSYGDKELFWLSFVINGDENFHFNKYHAASIGEINQNRVKSNGESFKSQELCAAHPAHIDGNDNSLVWFNSGFHFCGQHKAIDYVNELISTVDKFQFLKSTDEVKSYYYNPLNIKHAIVPPFLDKLKTYCPNEEEEPSKAWTMERNLCNSYLWCAYSSIGGEDNRQEGTIIEFDEDNQRLYEYYGDIWVGNE